MANSNFTYPHYTKCSVATFCFTSENKCIQVKHGGGDRGIIIMDHFPNSWMQQEAATFEDFERAYNVAATVIVDEINNGVHE